ncbi:hypothetical protein HETIRDRAFT_325220 [Heterobasidion irregulare TC 32-1]|uniref:Uncharacterized protein n=1 Tax=Heterobasidion irregulare (strain TC 32-1) TaxID=747525 RepID=W4JYV0_HETIT|nr:uncharacterized protein HETIRDRAFT_325220 [Heterobasidion irregulare TC 32-1]ETW78046.1 hypothetical protein HETIRDRAFT_325220 [Heterobasidion irregulare TC 32-1]
MTSPMKRSGSKSGVAGPAPGNKSKVNNENDEPKAKGIDNGTTRLPPIVDVLTLRTLDARSSITPSHPNLEQSMLGIEALDQSVPKTKKRTKSVRFALDQPRMQPPRTPKARSKKRLIRFEDHPGLSELEIGALRAARIMTMPSPPKFGAPDYDSDSDEEEDTINFMSRRPTRMKPAKVSAPPAEHSSGNIFARNGNIFPPIQAPSQVQAWPVGSYKAAMAAERAKKAEEKALREEDARKEAKQKTQDENAKRDAEEEAAVVQMLESSPTQSSEELPEAPTDAPQDALNEAPTEAPQRDPQQSTSKQADDIQEPEPAAPLSLCPSPPPPPPPQSHQPVSAVPESQLFPVRNFKQALDDITKVDAAKDTVEGSIAIENEEDWVIVDTPEPQLPSPEPSTQARRSPIIPQIMQRVTRSMAKKIQTKLRVISGSKNKPTATGSKTSTASRGAKARQIFSRAKPAGLARTQTRTISAAESRAQTTPPTIPKVRTIAVNNVELALTIPKPTSIADSEPTTSRPERNQLKRRWMDDDVQEASSTKRKLSGQAPPAKKAKLSSTSEAPVAVPQGPTLPASQEAISSPRVSAKRRRDADEEEDSSIGARLVKRLRRL